jgi:hypothetical protein
VSFDRGRLQVAAPRGVPPAVHPERCVLLFGDSFTFGIGVNDDETFAAQIVARSKGAVEVKNLAIGGWGPHQFLAGLQSGRFQSAVSCRPTDAVYLLIAEQIPRVAGGNKTDTHGPLFHLDAKGRPVRVGNFDTASKFSWRRLVGRSALTEAEEIELTAALLEEGRRELRRQYPGIRFHLLAWRGVPEEIMRRLDGHPMQRWAPDYTPEAYQIPIDLHPTARTHGRVAEYILSLPR